MVETSDIVIFSIASLTILFMVVLVGGFPTDGTVKIPVLPGNPEDPNPYTDVRCTLETSIGIEGTGTKIKLNEGSYRQKITESSFLGLTVTKPSDTFSLLEAKNVRVEYLLEGPSGPIQRTDSIGTVGKLGGSAESNFKVRNLEQGRYSLEMRLNWNTGSDFLAKNPLVDCGEPGVEN